jgi:hypothetical protein
MNVMSDEFIQKTFSVYFRQLSGMLSSWQQGIKITLSRLP